MPGPGDKGAEGRGVSIHTPTQGMTAVFINYYSTASYIYVAAKDKIYVKITCCKDNQFLQIIDNQ